jgi:hypothetical protein
VGCSSGGCGRCSDTGVIGCQSRVPFFENAGEGAVEGLTAGLQEKVRAFRRPLHLLLLAEARRALSPPWPMTGGVPISFI